MESTPNSNNGEGLRSAFARVPNAVGSAVVRRAFLDSAEQAVAHASSLEASLDSVLGVNDEFMSNLN